MNERSLAQQIADAIAGFMWQHNITEAELARRLRTSSSEVERMLGVEVDLLGDWEKILETLGAQWRLSLFVTDEVPGGRSADLADSQRVKFILYARVRREVLRLLRSYRYPTSFIAHFITTMGVTHEDVLHVLACMITKGELLRQGSIYILVQNEGA